MMLLSALFIRRMTIKQYAFSTSESYRQAEALQVGSFRSQPLKYPRNMQPVNNLYLPSSRKNTRDFVLSAPFRSGNIKSIKRS